VLRQLLRPTLPTHRAVQAAKPLIYCSMTPGHLSTKPPYAILDSLRGVAALIVVIFHLSESLETGHLDILVNHGYLAVDFFSAALGYSTLRCTLLH
jgi:hypothetical protein